MTEYDYSPEAYDRYMATQTRISNWIDTVSQSMHSSSQFSSHSSTDLPQYRSRPPYSHHSQTHSRSNSASRSHPREQQFYQREPSRQRSRSYSSTHPQATMTYHPLPHPMQSRTYSYALNPPPPPPPIPMPPPMPYSRAPPRRSRTLPPQPHNVVYHTYDAPRGGYVIVPPVMGGAPPQIRMHPAVTPKRPQPLLKRLFTSFGPWSSSSSGPSPKSKHPPPRRHRRRSSY